MASLLMLASVVVSAQGPLRPEAGMPSDQSPTVLAKVAFEQRLNEQLPLDLRFKDEDGRDVKLGDYFGKRPVVLVFVYYECPMLCTQVLNGLTGVLKLIDTTVGKDFDVVTVSFDPRETPVLATAKKKVYLDDYKRPESSQGWHFLTGDESSIAALTKAAGFSYVWDEIPSSSPTRAASSSRRPRGDSLAISSASITRRATCSSRSSIRRRARLGRSPRSCFSTAITTIRSRVSTDSSRCRLCGSAVSSRSSLLPDS